MPIVLMLSCLSSTADSSADSVPEEMDFQFSFVVLADPHISSNPEHQSRLETAVDWINSQEQDRSIELVVIVGDIGWGEGLETSASVLGGLSPTWFPVLGDNEIAYGDEARFQEVFAPQYEVLASAYPDYRRGQIQVEEDGQVMTLQNHVFTHRGLTWVGLDWNARGQSGLLSEFAYLHDVPGGSLPFLAEVLQDLQATQAEDILLFSHHPMHIGSFNEVEMASITDLTGPIEGRIAGAYAGHMHLNATVEVEEGGYTAWVTDATWDDENTLRVVSVFSNGERQRYEQELVVLD